MKYNLLLLPLAFLFIVYTSRAQVMPGIITDRPDQSESAKTVPVGTLQIETGFLYERDVNEFGGVEHISTNTGLLTTLLRVGAFSGAEIRLGFMYDNRTIEVGDNLREQGNLPLLLGIKTELADEEGFLPALAFIFEMSVDSINTDAFENLTPSFKIAASHTLTDYLGLGYNLGGQWDGWTGTPAGFYSVVLGLTATDELGLFAELYGLTPVDASPQHLFDMGLTVLAMNNLQFDASGGIGITENAPDFFIRAGFSWRLPE